jgi:hypothetical protein
MVWVLHWLKLITFCGVHRLQCPVPLDPPPPQLTPSAFAIAPLIHKWFCGPWWVHNLIGITQLEIYKLLCVVRIW